MINLHEEALYLQGARDILMRLKDDFEHYIIPYAYFPCKQTSLPEEMISNHKELFPINNTKIRKMIRQALIKTLTEDKQAMERFILGNFQGMSWEVTERDKKGNVKQIKVVVK